QFWELSQATQEIYVTANESLDLTLAVRSSQFPEMVKLETLRPEWGTAELTIGNGDTQGGWTVHSVVYTAPDDLTKLPGLLTATHTATTGARQHGGQVRKADVRILPVAVEITTEPTCLEPGDSLFIEVDLKGTNAAELVWSADAGTIRQDGLFIASDELPQVKVTVEVRDKAAASDFIYLQVGACTCQGVLTLNGTIPETERVYFTLTPDLTAVREVGWQGPLSTAGFTFGSTPGVEETVALGGTGTFPAVGGGIVDGVGLFANFGDGEDPPMTPLSADISENEGGNVLAGAVGGWVRLGDLENPVPFTLTFRVVADPAFSTATDRICYVNP
ncbi:MAG TPA: hypothetical protein VLA43_01505, partial [Longimicrobiales bacterium]|nr:hypothetical protein [Longimicrobiales bacterium]